MSSHAPLARSQWSAEVVVVALAYFGAAQLGLWLAFEQSNASPVWPPSGIALAALCLLGWRVWPGIAVGAFLANLITFQLHSAAAPYTLVAVSAGIAAGNTLEALGGRWLLRQLAGPGNPLDHTRDVFLLTGVALVMSLVSPAIGPACVLMAKLVAPDQYATVWFLWWLGDAAGVLVFTPLLLAWLGRPRPAWDPTRWAEAALLTAFVLLSSQLGFGGWPFPPEAHYPLPFLPIPFLLWAAYRFGRRGAATATATAATIAIFYTTFGYGPFIRTNAFESLVLVQVYVGVVGVALLALAAGIAERQHAQELAQASAAQQRHTHRLLDAIIEGTTDAVFVKDANGRYLMINTAGARFLGKTVAEVVGKDDTELFSAETAREIMERDRHIRTTGEVQTVEDVGTAAGVTRVYLSTKGPYRDERGSVTGLLGISRDITERKQAERRLRAEHSVARVLAEAVDLTAAASRVVQAVCDSLDWECGALWQVDRLANLLSCVEVWCASDVHVPDFARLNRENAFPAGVGLPGRVWDSGKPAWIPNLAEDPHCPRWAFAQREGLHGAFAIPIHGATEVLAVLEFFGREIREPDRPLLDMLESIARQIGQFLERRQAEKTLHERQREFALARQIQQGLLPAADPVLDGFVINGASQSTQETGGDYLDFIPLPDGHLAIAIGDASGHGVAAALVMAETRAYLRALTESHRDVNVILDKVNRNFSDQGQPERFITLFLARLDPVARCLVYGNAGHCPGYVLDKDGAVKAVLGSTGVPLGVMEDAEFAAADPLHLETGDLVFLYTDGITEAFSPDDVPFGLDRALALVREHRHRPAREIIETLIWTVRDFANAAPHDDVTAIVLQVGKTC